ncbi:MAG: alpha/beta fold hydrolase [Roseburia sp.]
MRLHEYGKENEKIIVMIHGACMSWDMFQVSVDILKKEYHIILVAVPGHDLTTKEEFTSVEQISERIENMLIQKGYQNIECLYGLSMGGGFVIRILADNRLNIKHAVIDAGITPYEMPWIQTRIILALDFLTVELGKHSRKLLGIAFPPKRYEPVIIDEMFQIMRHMTPRTIKRVFDSTDNYSMPETFPHLKTKIYYWYGADEKKARKLDIQYVKKYIPNVRFREIENMEHAQYVLMQPEKFAADLKHLIMQ